MKSYPFTSQVTYNSDGLPQYDRAVNSDFLRKVFAQYFSDGVFYQPATALQVTSGTGMSVQVAPGVCHIQGAVGIEEMARVLTVQASESLDRIDTVVARLDLSLAVRSIDLYVVKGAAAETPTTPELARNNTVWELGLANIFVAKDTTGIAQERVTDTRLDTARCGQVMVPLTTPDFEPYFAQLTAAISSHHTAAQTQIAELKRVIEGIEAGSEVMLKAVYDPRAVEGDALSHYYICHTTVAGWIAQEDGSYEQTVAASGVTERTILSSAIAGVDEGSLTIIQKQAVAEALGYINGLETGTDSITFVCYDSVPEVDMTLQVMEVR